MDQALSEHLEAMERRIIDRIEKMEIKVLVAFARGRVRWGPGGRPENQENIRS